MNLAASGITVPFYGTSYSQIYVDSNGYITFGALVPSQFQTNPVQFNSGPPMIAGFWTDLNPALGGAVNLVTGSTPAGVPFARVDWVGVPINGGGGGPPTYTFSTLIDATGLIQLTEPATPLIWSDTFVGIGPGGNLSNAPGKALAALKFAGGLVGQVNESFWEWYGLFTMPYYLGSVQNPYNLFGLTFNFLPAGAGGVPGSTNRYAMF